MYVSCCGDVKCCILMFECYVFHFFACVSVLFVCCAVNVLYYSKVFVITCFMFGAVKVLYVEMFVCYMFHVPVCGDESVFSWCVSVLYILCTCDGRVYVSCLWSKKVFYFYYFVWCMCSGQVFVEDISVLYYYVLYIICVPICFMFIC